MPYGLLLGRNKLIVALKVKKVFIDSAYSILYVGLSLIITLDILFSRTNLGFWLLLIVNYNGGLCNKVIGGMNDYCNPSCHYFAVYRYRAGAIY